MLLHSGLYKHMEGLTNDVEKSNEMVIFYPCYLSVYVVTLYTKGKKMKILLHSFEPNSNAYTFKSHIPSGQE